MLVMSHMVFSSCGRRSRFTGVLGVLLYPGYGQWWSTKLDGGANPGLWNRALG